jgi:hypothetical protein
MGLKQVVIDSSSLQWVAYDPEQHLLEVKFVGGGRYRYAQVPVALVAQLAAADSPGRFFNQVFKACDFPYLRLD